MFWPPTPFSMDAYTKHCTSVWGVVPRPLWASIALTGSDLLAWGLDNIVFSNGRFDPWGAGGVLHNVSASLTAVLIPNGAHHVDLMFSDPADTLDIVAAREEELRIIRRWIAQKKIKQNKTNKKRKV